MKEQLCKAFCDELSLRRVPIGFAVSTPFVTADGDRIGFFIQQHGAHFTLADDGLIFPILEANGVDFQSETRAEALDRLTSEYGVNFNEQSKEFSIRNIPEADIASAALRFTAFSLRVRDFMLMTEYRVASTFREDARKWLTEALKGHASLEENSSISDSLAEFPADFVVRASGRPPVGIFLGTSDSRVLEALVVHLRAQHEAHFDCRVIALLESARSVSHRIRQQATNRLDAVPEFRGDERSAAERIAQEVFGKTQSLH